MGGQWQIIDEVEGFDRKAILRWRLSPGSWQLKNNKCIGQMATIIITSDVSIHRLELTEGWESRHYLEQTALPVLEIEVKPAKATLMTEIILSGF